MAGKPSYIADKVQYQCVIGQIKEHSRMFSQKNILENLLTFPRIGLTFCQARNYEKGEVKSNSMANCSELSSLLGSNAYRGFRLNITSEST